LGNCVSRILTLHALEGALQVTDTPVAPPAAAPTTLTIEQVEALLNSRLNAIQTSHDAEMKNLQAALDAAHRSMSGTIPALVPLHAGGPGTEIAETWSAYEQAREHALDAAELEEAAA
jgi:hypothetical protein